MATIEEWLSQPARGLVPTVRAAQVEMAEACEDIFASGGIAFIEAGTGSGKSFAYALPALLSGKRVVISTGKKALQEQLFLKDLPHLTRTVLAAPFALLKGRTNYACALRWEELRDGASGGFLAPSEVADFEAWLAASPDGDLAGWDKPWLGHVRVGECVAKHCPHAEGCGYVAMRAAARAAKLLVVNHALLAHDLARGGGKLFGPYEALVIDEGHAAPEFFRDGASLALHPRQPEILARLLKGTDVAPPEALGSAYGQLFSLLPNREARLDQTPAVGKALDRIYALVATFAEALGDPEDGTDLGAGASGRARLLGAASLVGDVLGACEVLLDCSEDKRRAREDHVAHVERRGRDELQITITPLEVGPFVAPALVALDRVVVTSATLATAGGSMAYMLREYGLAKEQVRTQLVLPSPFDYSRTALYVSRGAPDPAKRGEEYYGRMCDELHALLAAARGGAFVLCASREDMDKLHDGLWRRYHPLPYRLGKQTTATPDALVAWFKEDPTSVLIGLKTFWEGVDVHGLRLVVIPRLPFPTPSDVVLSARKAAFVERLIEREDLDQRRAELNAWDLFDLQAAIMDVKQGAGRLMRSTEGYGIVALLDVRAYGRNKTYSHKFRNALPHPYTDNTAEVLDVLAAFGEAATRKP